MSSKSDDEMNSEDVDMSEDASGEISSPNTEDEIAQAQRPKKSKKTLKRKIRATSPSQFGNTLEALLNTKTPNDAPLALKPSLNRKRNDEKSNLRAKKALDVQKKEHEEVGRVTDVIGGWGGENERALRKVAQRGGNYLSSRVFIIF